MHWGPNTRSRITVACRPFLLLSKASGELAFYHRINCTNGHISWIRKFLIWQKTKFAWIMACSSNISISWRGCSLGILGCWTKLQAYVCISYHLGVHPYSSFYFSHWVSKMDHRPIQLSHHRMAVWWVCCLRSIDPCVRCHLGLKSSSKIFFGSWLCRQ